MHRHPGIHYIAQRLTLGIAALLTGLAAVAMGQEMEHTRTPLSFEHVGEDAFGARGLGYDLLLTPTEVRLALSSSQRSDVRLSLRFVGANPESSLVAEGALAGKLHRYGSKDPAQWRTDIPTYGRVRGESTYPGIDVVYYGNRSRLEYDFVVSPGADPQAIELELVGADTARIDAAGALVIVASGEELHLPMPVMYQHHDSAYRKVEGGYVMSSPVGESVRVSFRVDAYDPDETLVIDPIVDYATYLGGEEFDVTFAITVDQDGNAYIAGATGSLSYPTTLGAAQETNAGASDMFITKLDPAGQFVYSTYLGGMGIEGAFKYIVADDNGNVFLNGATRSSDFPTMNAAQSVFGGGFEDGFIVKLDDIGRIVYSTYLGGAATDQASVIDIDPYGNAYTAGITNSIDFPVSTSPAQATLGGDLDAFVTKLDPMGTIIYSTYLGGSNRDRVDTMAVDINGNAHISSETQSTDFPTVNAAYPMLSGARDMYVAKLDSAGAIVYSTYLGGSANELLPWIAVDIDSAYVVGITGSDDFPTLNAVQSVFGGLNDAFATKLDASGVVLYSTYLGGSGHDVVQDVAVDSTGAAVIVGGTPSSDFPVANALQDTLPGFSAGFVTKLDANGGFAYSTYFGGDVSASIISVALDDLDAAYLAGDTHSDTGLPILNAVQPVFGGVADAFVAKLTSQGDLAYSTYYGGTGVDGGTNIAVHPNGTAYLLGRTSGDLPVVNAVQPTFGGRADVFVLKLTPTLAEGIIDQVNALVDDGSINNGQGTSLINKIENALEQAAKGKADQAIKKLNDFIDQVTGLIGSGLLTPEQGQPLIDAANAMIVELGG